MALAAKSSGKAWVWKSIMPCTTDIIVQGFRILKGRLKISQNPTRGVDTFLPYCNHLERRINFER